MASTQTPIIIGSFYRSGSSLLRRILDSHSRIHCGPEVKFFQDFDGAYVQDSLAHLRFFKTALSLGLEKKEVLQEVGRAFVKIHEIAARRQGKTRWADKAPENALHFEDWHDILQGELRVIHLVRHPLDTLASLCEVGFPKTIPRPFVEKVDLYATFLEAAQQFERRHPDLNFTLRYESLVTAPEESLKTLLNWLGEPYEPAILNEHHANQRQKGIEDPKAGKQDKIESKSVERWVRDLNTQQICLAKQKLALHMSHYGYPA